MTQERLDLLGKARHLTKLRRDETYAWISPDELLILRPTVHVSGPYQPDQQRRIPSTAHRLQISTSAETPLSDFNRQHSESLLSLVGVSYSQDKKPQRMSTDAPWATFSPDGRYLLWMVGKEWRVASLDGKETVSIPASTTALFERTRETGSHIIPLWLADSRSWLAIGDDGVLKRRQIRQFRMDQPERTQTTFVLKWRDGFVCGVTADNTLLMQCPDAMQNITLEYLTAGKLPTETTFLAVGLGGRVRSARRFRLSLPTPGIIGQDYHRQIVISPDGRRLAWSIKENIRWSPQEITDFRLDPLENIYSLWTSDISGNDFQEIGCIIEPRKQEEANAPVAPVAPDNIVPTSQGLPWPDELQWSPDGRQISFTHRGNLFAVSTIEDGVLDDLSMFS